MEAEYLADQKTNYNDHQFHLVEPSPWPIFASFSLIVLAIGGVLFMHKYVIGNIIMPIGFIMILFTMYVWWRDVIKEGIHDQAHTIMVQKGLRIGMSLFILSEVMFFFAFFWSYFKAWLFPEMILDGVWPIKAGAFPPEGIEVFDPWSIPLINTLMLLLSGTSVTWAHHALLTNNRRELIQGLTITVILGFCFSILQIFEYIHAPFKFSQGVYAANFYMATGFHGFHVLVGTIFLTVCLFRVKSGHFLEHQGHLGFEFAAWYWHFVDVIWLLLFIFVYVIA